jgi:hypothetical protein
MNWVRAESTPKNECERLKSADPNDPKHNFHVVYAVNFALEMAGAIPGRRYAPHENGRISEKALSMAPLETYGFRSMFMTNMAFQRHWQGAYLVKRSTKSTKKESKELR